MNVWTIAIDAGIFGAPFGLLYLLNRGIDKWFELRQKVIEAEHKVRGLENDLKFEKDLSDLKDKTIVSQNELITILSKRPLHPSNPLSQETIRDAVLLCHPDKHGGSERANRVTAELNRLLVEQRRQAK